LTFLQKSFHSGVGKEVRKRKRINKKENGRKAHGK
jgi:hypothetical protein